MRQFCEIGNVWHTVKYVDDDSSTLLCGLVVSDDECSLKCVDILTRPEYIIFCCECYREYPLIKGG